MKKFIALLLVLVMVLSLSTVAFAKARSTLFNDVAGRIFDRVMTRVYKYSNELGNLIDTAMGSHDHVINGITRGIYTMADHFNPDDSFLAKGLNKCVDTIGTAFRYVYAFGIQR